MKRLLLAAAASTALAGCGTASVVHTITVAARHLSPTDTTPASHLSTGPPAGGATNRCGSVYAGLEIDSGPSTSCAFARNVFRSALAFFRRLGADAAHLTAYSPVTRKTYRLTCEIDNVNQADCSTGSGAFVTFPAFTSPPTSSAATTTTNSAASQPYVPPGPDHALCAHLYSEWRTGDAGSQAAIEQYGQMGCDLAPSREDAGATCPSDYGPWGYTPSGDLICAPEAGTAADTGNGDHDVTVPRS